MKADSDRGLWGAWLRSERVRRDWTVEEVAVRLAIKVDPATLRGIEGGSKKPSYRLQDALAQVFGSRPQDPAQDAAGVTETPPDLIAALQAQTAALDRQTAAIGQLVGWLSSLAGPAIGEGVAAALRDAATSPDEPQP